MVEVETEARTVEFAEVSDLREHCWHLRKQLQLAREQNEELLRQNALLENRVAGLEDEVKRYRKTSGGNESD